MLAFCPVSITKVANNYNNIIIYNIMYIIIYNIIYYKHIIIILSARGMH